MMRAGKLVLVLGMVILAAGCQRLSGGGNQQPAPLPATPTTPVGAGTLAPLDPNAPPVGTTSMDPASGATDLTSNPVSAPANAQQVGRTDLLGGWKVASAGDNCMAFMTLTSWSGGYRANTRGCTAPVLAGISAWDLSGNQVVLKDGSGVTVAQLYSSAPGQFSGQTSTGAPISLRR
ncbi:protease inhibitor Inh/omp19 family protein [Roseibium salinum]|uniref:Protease inhibitor Inh/omp19 family protein n=1 Tax=Roseibium salinum TaxID=1604349 RepID=A0ABT3R539_9HYPH|nr:protease inhibitor Inh/omp19 family protein [Roseibium sp. DSM 29163]MCX2724416.1 protease inhibitor Inh/omp19 family protein [Roseibium sp. DSM 29163]